MNDLPELPESADSFMQELKDRGYPVALLLLMSEDGHCVSFACGTETLCSALLDTIHEVAKNKYN